MKNINSGFIFKLIAVAIAAFFVINYGTVNGYINKFFDLLQPIIIGIVLAMALSVPLNFFQRKVYRKIQKQKLRDGLAMLTTLLIFACILITFCLLIIPQGVKSVQEIIASINSGETWNTLNNLGFLGSIGDTAKGLYENFVSRITEYLPKIIDMLQDVFTGLYNIVFGTVIAIMLLLNRDNVKLQLKRFIYLIFKDKNLKIHGFLQNALNKFSKYLGGQLVEAMILGTACYITMLILKVPYAALIGLIIGFMNLIPILGAYIGGAVCAIIVFAVSPAKALVFLVAVIILQQIEGFTTYPIIVGKYVGLNGFWITISIIIWGGIFSFWGMFLGVPLSAFLFDVFDKFYAKKSIENKFSSDLSAKR